MDWQPAGLDLGDSVNLAISEPGRGDLTAPASIVVQWRQWEQWGDGLGAWSGDVRRIGMQDPREPLALGPGAVPIVSPDGRLIAHSDLSSGEVTVLDLAAWQPVLTVQTAPHLYLHAWSEDGSQIYGWREHCDQTADRGVCPSGPERDLWRIDIAAGSSEQLFIFDFSVSRLAIPTEKGATRAYALGSITDICCGINPQGDPFIAVLNLEDGRLMHRIELPGLLSGQYNEASEHGRLPSHYPALILSPDGTQLYLIEAAEDAVVVVDTETFAVERVEIREKRSALSRFGDWLRSQIISTAEAKSGASFNREASITPEGRYLIIGGTSAQVLSETDGPQSLENRPLGVMVVDTADMTITHREDEASWFKLSPDGRWLLTYGAHHDESSGQDHQGGGSAAYGLKVIDLTNMKLTGHLWPGEDVQPQVFSPDSRYVYITSDGPGMLLARQTGADCGRDCSRLNLLELATGEILWQGELEDGQTILAYAP